MRAVLLVVSLGALTAAVTGAVAPVRLPTFEDVAVKSGIDFIPETGSKERNYILESNAAGVVLLDYDNDGWPDIYFINGSTPDRMDRHEPSRGNRLYRNNHNGTFTDVTAKAGVAGNGAWGMGGCVGDVDNNGFDDIFITNYGRDVLYLNNGDGTFRDVSKEAGIEGGERWHSGCAFGDYNADGKLDLYVSVYAEFSLEAAKKDPRYVNPMARRGQSTVFNPGPLAYKTQPHEFYENLGAGRFQDVTEKSGILKASAVGHGFGVVWGDFDNDGRPDIYVADDETPNLLFHNNGDKTFTEVGVKNGAAFDADGKVQGSMGVDTGDFDNDGNLDLIVTNFDREHYTLYRGDGHGLFTDVSKAAGLVDATRPFLGWGTQFVDLDLDGYLDMIAVNGHVYPRQDDIPRFKALQAGYSQRWLAFRNRTDGTFDEVGRDLGAPFLTTHLSRGLAMGDLNNDGQMDFVILDQESHPSVLMNRGVPNGHWSLIKLRGAAPSNRSAIGARVTARTGTMKQMREVKSGGSYLSQSDLRVHFGLGAATRIDELTIRWPSGKVQIERNVPANKIITLQEK